MAIRIAGTRTVLVTAYTGNASWLGLATATLGGGEGTLSMTVWPMYVGLCAGVIHEPLFSVDYERGQIKWVVMPNGEIIGSAEINVPAGEYTHLTYHYGPGAGDGFVGQHQLHHPLRFSGATIVAVDPINQGDWK